MIAVSQWWQAMVIGHERPLAIRGLGSLRWLNHYLLRRLSLQSCMRLAMRRPW